MRYVSTRGRADELGFADVLLAGLATDGGLYVPERWPELAPSTGRSYVDRAVEVMLPFVEPDLDEITLTHLCEEAYATFRHDAVVPLVQIGSGQWIQELVHGPTLAFKDVALQLVGRMFDHVLEQRNERVTIVGATSGDTGSAAIDGVAGCDNVDIVILYPLGRTSEVQRRQMTTVDAPNAHAVAVEGTFDDCQDLVKAMFADEAFRERTRLSAVNSINWARVMAQIVYYVWAAQLLGRRDRPTTFCVPTGNFGNVFAGHVAARMGLPVERFLLASNRNDILTRLIETGELVAEEVVPTLSPSMDIQISSNLERLLVELLDGDGPATAEIVARFRDSGRASLTPAQHERLVAEFTGARLDDDETLEVIRAVHAGHGMLVDPHTAVGIGVARRVRRPDETVVTLATAHPAKFPDAVETATGIRPPLPAKLAGLLDRPEHFAVLPNDLALVQEFVDGVGRVS